MNFITWFVIMTINSFFAFILIFSIISIHFKGDLFQWQWNYPTVSCLYYVLQLRHQTKKCWNQKSKARKIWVQIKRSIPCKVTFQIYCGTASLEWGQQPRYHGDCSPNPDPLQLKLRPHRRLGSAKSSSGRWVEGCYVAQRIIPERREGGRDGKVCELRLGVPGGCSIVPPDFTYKTQTIKLLDISRCQT